MTAIAATPGKLDMGEVIQTTFAVLRRNLSHLVMPLCVLVLPSSLASSAFLITKIAPVFSPLYWAVLVVSIVCSAWFQATGIQILIADMGGGAQADVGASVRQSLGQLPSLVAVMILNLFGMFAGSVLLIVPGLMVAVAFSVALQARVVERTGVFAAFDRSRQLTRGNRWRIFGLIALLVIVYGVIQTTLYALLGPINVVGETSVATVIAMLVLSLITALISLSGSCVLYAELRRIKDGAGVNDLSAVFD